MDDNTFVPLCNYTHYSLQYGFSKPKELVKKCVDNGYKACGIADYKDISGAVSFFKECKKSGIKPIIGCSFDGYKLFAKNKQGWLDLIEVVSSDTYDPMKRGNLIRLDSLRHATGENQWHYVSQVPEYFYANQSDADIHRISLCSHLKTTIPDVKKNLSKAGRYQKFFIDDSYYIPNEMDSSNANSIVSGIVNQCEDYNILKKPMLPAFPTPNGESEEEYLKQLCREGWVKHLVQSGKVTGPENKELKQVYLDRFQEEFGVIKGAELFGYFLIVWDVLHFINGRGWLSGPGRGSAAGCLISYLIEITKIDPVEFDLIFSRFYNAGRNTADHVSLPDIDVDVPGGKRDEVIDYLRDRYGHEHVSQMITYGRLQGRSSLKEVLRINKACGFAEMNAMTKPIPNEADISDQLELMDEEDRSIILWTLINQPEDLMQWCHLTEEGELRGDYASYFDQAIRLEGTFKSLGKHAAGVVISRDPLHKVCPMMEKDGEMIAKLEMNDLEAIGQVKLDILGLTLLDKLMRIEELMEGSK